ncbi:hypothetical protein HMPREF9098_1258 [Kingella denitrificans ATCC 33394]|uniref:Uncharacterized protein n=1 Tax=Kingella denitrificans ATCC 33394 TaxID=888741 RepID=F0EZS3_9NEIS|nr:hypothetical protein HMPREF9098_1258 [Kingella denitrificans ATCC 33394]
MPAAKKAACTPCSLPCRRDTAIIRFFQHTYDKKEHNHGFYFT